jgi:hypothetical protein
MEIDSLSTSSQFSILNPISTNKEWFEFLLDLNLLDKHLINEPNPGMKRERERTKLIL